MVIIKRDDNPRQMRQRTSKNQYMEDVMRAPDEIEAAREPSLGHSESIDECSSGVYNSFESKPAPAHLYMRLRNTICERGVSHRQNTRKSKRKEHARTEGIPRRLAEPWDRNRDSRAGSYCRDLRPSAAITVRWK